MGIFDTIKTAIWGEEELAQATPTAEYPLAEKRLGTTPFTPDHTLDNIAASDARSSAMPAGDHLDPGAAVDVEAALDERNNARTDKLNWRTSIVDLMKTVGMDASLVERQELAAELGYAGDIHDSAKMNIFLHRALMTKLAENGGLVPAELRD